MWTWELDWFGLVGQVGIRLLLSSSFISVLDIPFFQLAIPFYIFIILFNRRQSLSQFNKTLLLGNTFVAFHPIISQWCATVPITT